MATIYDGSTPPPPTLHTPSTPRHGFLDEYQPYSPRKVTPLALASKRSQGVDRKNKPPITLSHNLRSHHTPPPMSSTKVISSHKISPRTPQIRSKKMGARNSSLDIGRNEKRTSLALSLDSSKKGPLSLTGEDIQSVSEVNSPCLNSMLPTPAKTPAKRPRKVSSSTTSVARNLFLTQPATCDVKSFSAKMDDLFHVPTSENVAIAGRETFNDIMTLPEQKKRGPTIDCSENNPFYTKLNSNPPKSNDWLHKRKKVLVPGEEMQTIEDLQKRDDGLLCIFRGKTYYRKFEKIDQEALGSSNNELSINLYSNHEEHTDPFNESFLSDDLYRPLSRSSLKPRILFPPIQFSRTQEPISLAPHDIEDEEAETDIEDASSRTPKRLIFDKNITPKASMAAPISPLSTPRATVSRKLDFESLPKSPLSTPRVTRSRKLDFESLPKSPLSTPRVTRSRKLDFESLPKSPLSTPRVTRSKMLDFDNLPKSPLSTTRVSRLKFNVEKSSKPLSEYNDEESTVQLQFNSRSGRNPNPFSLWQRTKSTTETQSKKRTGEPLSRPYETKRAKT